MSTIFIYYSHSGNGDLVADYMRDKGAEVRKIERRKPMPQSFFAAVMQGGFMAGIGHKDKLRPWDPSVEGYDRVVIGSPIWNGKLSCPINTVLATLDLSGKAVDFVLYAGGGQAPKTERRLAEQYPSAKVIMLKEPKKFAEELDKLASIWAE